MNVRNSAQHVILGTQQFRPMEFTNNIALNLDNCWGILRTLIDFFMRQPQGKYLMLKDPLQVRTNFAVVHSLFVLFLHNLNIINLLFSACGADLCLAGRYIRVNR